MGSSVPPGCACPPVAIPRRRLVESARFDGLTRRSSQCRSRRHAVRALGTLRSRPGCRRHRAGGGRPTAPRRLLPEGDPIASTPSASIPHRGLRSLQVQRRDRPQIHPRAGDVLRGCHHPAVTRSSMPIPAAAGASRRAASSRGSRSIHSHRKLLRTPIDNPVDKARIKFDWFSLMLGRDAPGSRLPSLAASGASFGASASRMTPCRVPPELGSVSRPSVAWRTSRSPLVPEEESRWKN
jgi:hypothetical protein